MSFENALPEDWKTVLPAEMQTSGVLATATTVESLAKMAIDGRNLANTALRIPSAEASDDDKLTFRKDLMEKMPDLMFKPNTDDDASMKEFQEMMGAPKDLNGYKMPEMPDAIKENMGKVAASALKAGLTPAQFDVVTEGILADYKEGSDENAGNREIEKGKLKETWGAAYDQKTKTVAHFAKQTGFSEDFIAAIEGGQVSASDMVAFDKVVSGFDGEGINIGRQPDDMAAVMPPAEAEAMINDIMGNKTHDYWNASAPGHKAAVDKIVELGRLAEGKAA